jgi:hypothetical protein
MSIHNIHAESDIPVSIQIVSENMTRDGITVTLEWMQDNHTFYSYDVSVTPHAVSIISPTMSAFWPRQIVEITLQ